MQTGYFLTFANPQVNLKNSEKEKEKNEQRELDIKKAQAIHICLFKGKLITG